MGEWISGDERQPEDDTSVLACAVGSIDQCIGLAYYEDGALYWDDGGSGGEITHWMPLPEPPGSEEV